MNIASCLGLPNLIDDEEKLHLFHRVMIDTEFGELEIAHTSDQVSEEELPLIKAGATVFGAFMVYGDCAIYEYENGIVKDEEHDLLPPLYPVDGRAAGHLRGA